MTRFLLRRLAASLFLLFLVLTVTFFLLHLAPGDPSNFIQNDSAPREYREHLRSLYGLDRPLPEQYLRWLGAVARGDWGVSFSQHRPVARALADALPATLLLAGSALLVQYGAGLALGVAAARRQGKAADHLIRVGSLLLYSQPVFWLGLMAVLLFSLRWPILPASHLRSVGAEDWGTAARLADLARHLVLPALVLGLSEAGGTARFVRNSLLEVMGREYMRTARAKGLSERRVIWVHGMRTALLPVIQLFALSLPALLNGSLVTEVVFALPGLGRLTVDAIYARDYPLILATTAFGAALVLAGNLLADLLQALTDPRTRDA